MVTVLDCVAPILETPKEDNGPHVPQLSTTVFNDPRHLLNAVGVDLEGRGKESNIVYAHAYKLASQLRAKDGASVASGQFWITCHSRQNGATTLELVLSCTEGPLGPYPIFIYSHRPTARLCTTAATLHLKSCVSALARSLHNLVPPSRVFSVFSITSVTNIFATEWSTLIQGIYPVTSSPWYEALSSYCTIETLRGSKGEDTLPPGHVMRRATMDDLDQCAALCDEFARTGPPYELNISQARKEAEGMIQANQLWVYQLPTNQQTRSTSDTSISTILAVTRSTPTVSAITKVYTTPAYRSRGCAERLVFHVTNDILRQPPKKRGGCPRVDAHVLAMQKQHAVVLFVGHTLDATRVYRRVGFVGLDGSKNQGAEDWLELGFEGANLGHW